MNRLRNIDWLAVVIYPLAVVLMEAFWVYPWLVWLGVWPVFVESRPAVSLASVIIVLALSLIVTRATIRQEWPEWTIRAVVIGCGLITIFFVLRIEYSAGYSFFSGGWFSYVGQILRSTFKSAHPAVIALPVLLYLWWRGIILGRTTSYFKSIYNSFLLGMVALILLIIFWQLSSGSGDFGGPGSNVGLYVIAFFFFGLVALAIGHLYVMRSQMHREDAAMTSVWRWLPIMTVVIIGMVVIGLGAASIFSTEFFAAVKEISGVIFGGLGKVFYYILIPFNYIFAGIIYLLRLLINLIRPEQPPELQESGGTGVPSMQEVVTRDIPPVVTTVLQWLVIVAIVAIVIYILARAISRVRARRERDEIEEIHESLWSMSGLRDDLRLLLNMLGRKFQRKPGPARAYHFDEDAPGRMDIREIYRHLLWEGARSGVPHRKHETTVEYEGRLGQYVPDGKGPLARITGLYDDVRYGEIRPGEEQVDSANDLWKTLRSAVRRLRGD
jgi:hypothetical protein